MDKPAEVQELRNKLRMMKLPQDEILNVVRRQQRAIYKQKLANDTIRNEITEYEQQIRNLDKDIEKYKTNEELQKLNTQFKNLTNKNSIIQADFAAEEGKRKKLEEEVSKANSRAGGLYKQLHENENLQSRLRTMENRLDKSLMRYNRTLIKLDQLRNQIDEIRKNRMTFRSIIKNADADSERKDKELSNLISISNDAYSERDRMKMELVRIKQAEKEDIQIFEAELARLNQTIEGQRLTSNRPREHSTVPSINSTSGSQSDQQEELTQLTDQMQATIQRTLDITETSSVEELISKADQIESKNFSLYNFVVEHGSNKAKLQDEIDGLELQHDKLQQQIDVKDNEQSETFQEITKKIENVTNQLKETTLLKEKNEEDFKSIYSAIERLFDFYECSWDEAPDESRHVGPLNAMYCLSAIETQAAIIMNQVCEKAKVLFQMRGQDPKSLVTDERSDTSAIRQAHSRVVDKESFNIKCIDSNKPLSLEEMRALLA